MRDGAPLLHVESEVCLGCKQTKPNGQKLKDAWTFFDLHPNRSLYASCVIGVVSGIAETQPRRWTVRLVTSFCWQLINHKLQQSVDSLYLKATKASNQPDGSPCNRLPKKSGHQLRLNLRNTLQVLLWLKIDAHYCDCLNSFYQIGTCFAHLWSEEASPLAECHTFPAQWALP